MKTLIVLAFTLVLFNSCCYSKREYYQSDSNEKIIEYDYHVNLLTGKKCGKLIWFDNNGDTLHVFQYKNGMLNGVAKFYNFNKLTNTQFYVNDSAEGKGYNYYENGSLSSEVVYKNDKLWQINSVYDSLGNSLFHGDMRDGYGHVIFYYPNGIIKHEGSYVNGFKSGYWRYYDRNGALYDSAYFRNGMSKYSTFPETVYF